jgi:uncharacterized protein (TIGR02145 family)
MQYKVYDKYEFLNLDQVGNVNPIGEGGMAKVYLAQHKIQHNQVAIKVLNEDLVFNTNIRSRFIAEAKSLANLSHRNVIKVIDTYDDDVFVAFVMEFIGGPNLQEIIENGKLTDQEIVELFSQLLNAVKYIHDNKITHRDIKPSNVIIGPNQLLKLVDFGIAKHENKLGSKGTTTHVIMGTPSYMSPEQIRSTATVTSQSDIYSLGVVLWEMVTGKSLYNTMKLTSPEIQTQILNNNLPKTKTKWDRIIEKCTEKQLFNRYKSCDEILKEINIICNTTIEDYTTHGQYSRNKKSNKKRNLILFGIFVICGFYIHYKNYPTFYSNSDAESVEEMKDEKTIIDIDNNEYHLVKIGEQIWFKENFSSTTFRNGDPILQAQSKYEWEKAGLNHQPAWCFHQDAESNDLELGKLYNWYAVADNRGLAPAGFKVPTKDDWNKLHEFIGKNNSSGIKIIKGENWDSKLIGDNRLGFSAIPAGYRTENNLFSSIGHSAAWWTSSSEKDKEAIGYAITESELKTNSYLRSQGFSVRLIKLK